MNAFTSISNSISNIDLTKQGVSLLVRDSFCRNEDGWWVAGYATNISVNGCECHPIMVKPSDDQSTLYVKTSLKGGAADILWEALEERCPEFHNVLRG